MTTPMTHLAQASIPQPPVPAPQPFSNISQIFDAASVCTIINWIFWLIIIFSIITTLSAAFKYLIAGGDAERVKAAGSTLIYVVIAIAVALIAKGFPLIISSFLGANLTSVGC